MGNRSPFAVYSTRSGHCVHSGSLRSCVATAQRMPYPTVVDVRRRHRGLTSFMPMRFGV